MRAKPHWRIVLTTAVAVGIASHLLVLLFLGDVATTAALSSARFVSWIGIAVFLLWLAFERWFWMWLPQSVLGWPNLNGTWSGTGYLTFIKDRDLQAEPVTLQVRMLIRQTYTKVFVSFWSKSSNDQRETTSEAYAELVQRSEGDGAFILQYVFTTNPGAFAPNQQGFATLTLLRTDRDQLVGEWLFNPTAPAAGRLELTRR